MLDPVSEGPRRTNLLEIGSALWTTAEAIYLVGLIVFAFDAGGPSLVALVTVLRSLPSVVLAPALMAATFGIRRQRLLAVVLRVRCATVAAMGVLLALEAPVVGVLLLAAIDGLASTILRPIRGTLVPMIARSPEELVAANVGITTGMSAASLLGPAVAAVSLSAGNVQVTFLFATALFVVALLTVTRLRAFPRDGEISPPAFTAVLETMAEMGLLGQPVPGAARYVDLSYLEQARKGAGR